MFYFFTWAVKIDPCQELFSKKLLGYAPPPPIGGYPQKGGYI